MTQPSWTPRADSRTTIASNWLFDLVKVRFTSRRSRREHDFFLIELPDAVHVIALTPERRVVLVRQFRVGSNSDAYEPPGGLVDEGEDVLEAASRELLEETGYAGDPPVLVSQTWAVPSLLSARIFTVLITNAVKVAEPCLDEGEELDVTLVSDRLIPAWIRDGRINHALCVQGLLAWLIAEIPHGPWPLPEARRSVRNQFELRTLLAAIAFLGVLFAGLRFTGPTRAALLWGSVSLATWWTMRWLDPSWRSTLLRPTYFSMRSLVLRLLAVVALLVLFWMAAILLWRVFRL